LTLAFLQASYVFVAQWLAGNYFKSGFKNPAGSIPSHTSSEKEFIEGLAYAGSRVVRQLLV
jgi:hypothetical protein